MILCGLGDGYQCFGGHAAFIFNLKMEAVFFSNLFFFVMHHFVYRNMILLYKITVIIILITFWTYLWFTKSEFVHFMLQDVKDL